MQLTSLKSVGFCHGAIKVILSPLNKRMRCSCQYRCGLDNTRTGSGSSYARYDRACELMRGAAESKRTTSGTFPDLSVDDVKRILADGEGELPILRPYCPYRELGLDAVGTCCSVVMELDTL
eukprot:jgi/Bigna1/62723/fgenesh1_kg.40_\